VKSSNPGEVDSFGGAVAISGDTIVVGAASEDSNAVGVNGDQSNELSMDSGAAYVFSRSSGSWAQVAYLKTSNTMQQLANFGCSVAIDGTIVLVGARNESSNAVGINGDGNNRLTSRSGAAYAFALQDGQWTHHAFIKNEQILGRVHLGSSVAVGSSTLVVGAPLENSSGTGINPAYDDGEFGSGAAFIFPSSPGPPAITGVARGDGLLSITFTAASSGGSPLTNYQYSIDDGANFTARSPAATTSPIVIAGLTNGTTYSVRIRAVNASGVGASSSSSEGTPSTTPAAPTITGITASDGQLSVAFTAGATGGSALTNYEYSTDNGVSFTARSPVSTTSPLVIGALSNGTTYAVRVRAVNANGSGSPSDPVSATPRPVPTVTAVMPNAGATSGGNRVTVSGTGFTAGATVAFGGSAATEVAVINATSLTATVPSGSIGAATVTVTTSGGTGSLAAGYTYFESLFSDDPLAAGLTIVKAAHITELRQRIDALRARYLLPVFSWTDATLSAGTTVVKRVHLVEMRTALSDAYAAAGRTAPVYTNATVTSAVSIISARDISELRAAVTSLW
jgi:hypothetical protein